MAVKDFKVEQGQKAIVVDGNGKAYKMDKLSKRVQNAMVIGTDIYNNDLGEPILHIWID
jgi:pentose-5-phosphate-3-epimerase